MKIELTNIIEKSITTAIAENSKLRDLDFCISLNESNREMIEKLVGKKYSLVQTANENINTYIERVFNAFPELFENKEILLGLAIILQRNKTN